MPEPLIPTLPDTTKSLERKYTRLAPILQSLPPDLQGSLINFDVQRTLRGQSPLSERQTAQSLITALSGQAFTPPPEEPSIFKRFTEDVRTLTSSIPRLPAALVQEVKDLPDIPQELAEAFAAGSPSKVISELSTTPGIRLIPGAFAAGQIAREGPSGLLDRPLFTALDLLPVARTPAGRVLTKPITNRLAQAGAPLVQAAGRTRSGQLFKEAFSPMAREQARLKSAADIEVQRIMHGDVPPENPLDILAQQSTTLAKRYPSITPERRQELTALVESNPTAISTLPDIERSFVDEARDLTGQFATINKESELLSIIDGEAFDLRSGKSITKALTRQEKARTTLQQEIDTLRQAVNPATDPMVGRFLQLIDSNDLMGARKLAHANLARRKKATIPNLTEVVDALSTTIRAERRAGRVVASTPPARFQPLIQGEVNQRLIAQYSTPESAAEVTRLVGEQNYSLIPGFQIKEMRKIQNEVKRTWQDLKESGANPIFVHRVSPSQALSIDFPNILESVRTPSQVKARTNDATPYVQDITVGLSHQALELLSRRSSETFVDEITTRWGKTERDLIQDYLPIARTRSTTPQQTRTILKDLIDKEWVEYNPRTFIPWRSARLSPGADKLYLPKTLANNFRRMHTPAESRLTTSLVDPVMKVFRTSLLPLSPRWHLYNILGGGILLTSRTSPTVWRYFSQAKQMMKEGGLPEGAPPGGFGTIPKEMRLWDKQATQGDRVGAAFQFKSGQKLRELWDQSQSVRDKFNNVVQKSYDFNGFFDDTYRAMAYLYGYDKTVAKGLSTIEAKQAGISLVRKVMQNWDEMTPIERTIMRYVFPFYGWMAHIMRYTLTYPFDHPVRAAVMSSFARNELEDMGTGLPTRFLNSFFLGKPDSLGNVKAIQLQGMNPFADVANYFTLAGFMGSTNPLISSVLEIAGLDPLTGGPNLFPNLRYDPNVGRLRATSDNPVTTFLSNIVPQSRILFGMAQSTSEFKELLRTNPDAAARMLRSQLGLPVLFRDINIPQEQIKAEVARDEAQRTALNQALKSGQYGGAEVYPALRPLLDQVRELQSAGVLQELEPPDAASPIDVAQQALVRLNVP